MLYRFKQNGKLFKFNTATATLLFSNRWECGQERTRWQEIYVTPQGRYISIGRSLWQGERDYVSEIDKEETLYYLALADPEQRTPEGDALLEKEDPCENL